MIGSLLMRILRHHAESHPKRPAIHGLSMLGAKVGSHRCQRDLHIWCPGALPERTGGYEVRAAKIFKIVCVGGAITDRTIEASPAVDSRDDKMPLGVFKDLAGERQSNVVVAPVTRPANEPVAAPAGPPFAPTAAIPIVRYAKKGPRQGNFRITGFAIGAAN